MIILIRNMHNYNSAYEREKIEIMNCPKCEVKMKLKTDYGLNEKYYDCSCGFNILKSLTKVKISKKTERIIKYS